MQHVACLQRLKKLGFEPTVILDLGAHHGRWSSAVQQSVWPQATYHLVEAIAYQELEPMKSRFQVHAGVLLADTGGLKSWWEGRNTGDSMFQELTGYYAHVRPVFREATTLNLLFQAATILPADRLLIKLDCQGAEIPILQGGSNFVNRAEVILMEMPLATRYNAGVASFAEHIAYMTSIGFQAFDLAEMHQIGPVVNSIDLVFVRQSSPLLTLAQNMIHNLR